MAACALDVQPAVHLQTLRCNSPPTRQVCVMDCKQKQVRVEQGCEVL
jgi:hypothetical protein